MTQDKSIFIKNIYYMLTYAFSDLHQSCMEDIAVEKFDNIHDLFASILVNGISLQLKRGLHRTYLERQDVLPVMRGKINLPETIRNRIAHKNVLTCNYDELSENNLFNQILKTTVRLLFKHGEVSAKNKIALKKILPFFSDIDEIKPAAILWTRLGFQRSNQTYQLLLGICRLVFDGLLLTTTKGEHKLASFLSDECLHRLYEKFILAFYRKRYPLLHAHPAQIPWILDPDDSRAMLPIMQTDITLSLNNKILIIDAKYYSQTLQHQYDSFSIHSHNLYQIFTYVKNKEAELAGTPHEVAGLILYAKTNEAIQPDNSYTMSGNRIQARTLDLNCDFSVIVSALDYIVQSFFGSLAVL
ncbi:MAG: 5-methylcytosine-specific restriction endonuclease system specificity protein McrC [Lentisphaerae bacterium]|nr:5-methylcytosine-specific restriction endonuclease system specificity protein McrC [Lentisphaerota bacterium]